MPANGEEAGLRGRTFEPCPINWLWMVGQGPHLSPPIMSRLPQGSASCGPEVDDSTIPGDHLPGISRGRPETSWRVTPGVSERAPPMPFPDDSIGYDSRMPLLPWAGVHTSAEVY